MGKLCRSLCPKGGKKPGFEGQDITGSIPCALVGKGTDPWDPLAPHVSRPSVPLHIPGACPRPCPTAPGPGKGSASRKRRPREGQSRAEVRLAN